ncbi:MAG: phosphoribosylamine--glycine ligase, partial [Candidatus Nanopelagicales bacterium]
MRILVVGSGGREHAIIHTLKKEPNEIFATGSNAGIINTIGLDHCFAIDITNPAEVLKLAKELAVELVVIGPEAPLVAGVTDKLIENGILVFGPSKAAAQIEASKAFAKELMEKLGIPTARSFTCENLVEVERAISE